MTRLSLRQAYESDIQFAFLAKKAAFKEYAEQVWGWDEEEQWRLHQRRFSAQEFRVVVWDDAEVGILAMEVAPDCLKLNQLFLLPEYQGKGIGQEVMAQVVAEAKKLRLPIRLRVLKVNPRAAAFYDRIGFQTVGETDTHVQMELPHQEGSSGQY